MYHTQGLGDSSIGGAVERVERVPLKAGVDGTHQTVALMAKAAMGQYGAGSAKIRNLAVQIVRDAGVAERDKRGETIAIHAYVMRHLRYVKDPLWYEFVTYPETLAFERHDGDCDDHAVLEAALLGSLGIPTRFVVYGFKGAATYAHVALHAMVGAKEWLPLDPIMKDKPAGWEVPDATMRHVYGMNTPDGPQGSASTLRDLVGLLLAIGALWAMYRSTMQRLEKQ